MGLALFDIGCFISSVMKYLRAFLTHLPNQNRLFLNSGED